MRKCKGSLVGETSRWTRSDFWEQVDTPVEFVARMLALSDPGIVLHLSKPARKGSEALLVIVAIAILAGFGGSA